MAPLCVKHGRKVKKKKEGNMECENILFRCGIILCCFGMIDGDVVRGGGTTRRQREGRCSITAPSPPIPPPINQSHESKLKKAGRENVIFKKRFR